MKTAVAYYVGADPSLTQQREAVQRYAAAHRLKLGRDYWDANSEASDRTGFTSLLAHVLGRHAQVVLVERPERVAPDPAATGRM